MAEHVPENGWTLPPARWPWQRSLQRRILFTYGAVFLIILALLMAVVGRVVYRAAVDEAQHTLEVEAFLVANALEDPRSGYAAEFEAFGQWETEHGDEHDEDTGAVPPGQSLAAHPTQRLQGLAALFAGDSGSRVAILDPQGTVVADSVSPFYSVPNQLKQPEVQDALNGAEPSPSASKIRIDSQSGHRALFAAAPIQLADRVLGIVQISRPVSAVVATIRPLLVSLAVAGLLALVVATLLGIGLSRRLASPVHRLEEAALAMAGGDLQQHVPVETPDELGELAIAFNVMAREVRESFAQQRAFVANASHELRTPLTNIKLRSEALLGGAADDARVRDRYLVEIDREADRLGRLASALLDLSRLDEAGPGQQAVAAPVDIRPLLRSVVEAIAPRASQAGLSLVADIPETLPGVRVRPEDQEAIVVNLLDNALKYTPTGGKVRLAAQANGSHCQISVADSGPGIPTEDLPHIFERFYRVDKARSRQSGPSAATAGSGAGLGLSIAQALVEENGGTIEMESVVGQGTTFTVQLSIGDE